jgi:hypothetical protein
MFIFISLLYFINCKTPFAAGQKNYFFPGFLLTAGKKGFAFKVNKQAREQRECQIKKENKKGEK